MKKKRPADKRGGVRAAKVSKTSRRHLYLVMDDWKQGYSIRKLNLSSSDDSDDCQRHQLGKSTEQRLPPAMFRLEAPHGEPDLFAAWGSKIVATHQTPRRAILMWDISTRTLTFGPRHKIEPNLCSVYVEVNGSLFVLGYCGFEMLEPPPPPPEDLKDNVEIVWKWVNLPADPLKHYDIVVSHAVHSDERTIFYSIVKNTRTKKGPKAATFSFDTESRIWTCRGTWRLPFTGRGYVDPELEAWVGLSDDDLGHLCACELVSTADDAAVRRPPSVKLSKEKLFCVDPAEKHIGATLVYMGSRSQYCLVQSFSKNDREQGIWNEFLPERPRYLLRVTTFSLKYDRNGDLCAVVHGHVRSYRLPKNAICYYADLEKPVAFWI